MTMFRLACGIELDDKFVVTGGKFSNTKVAQYTEAGAVTYLPSLKTARYDHACSKFVKDNGETVSSSYYLVLNTYFMYKYYTYCIGKLQPTSNIILAIPSMPFLL